MGKSWSLLFGVTMAGCFGLFVAAPFVTDWWLPQGVSTHAWDIDKLFYIILAITGIFFVLTEAVLVGFLYRYATTADGTPPKLAPSKVAQLIKPITNVLNDPHKIELAWTIVPAGILLWIAFAQVNTWAEVKFQSRYPDFVGKDTIPVVMEISARQFEWRVRYPSKKRLAEFLAYKTTKDATVKADFESFARRPQFDDLKNIPNAVHVISNYPVLIHLGTQDVIHSLNFPHMRIKQDALPGKIIPVWFIPTKYNTIKDDKTGKWIDGYNPDTKEHDNRQIWDLACAELCGWGHKGMIGRLYVHKDAKDFLDWLDHAENEANATSR